MNPKLRRRREWGRWVIDLQGMFWVICIASIRGSVAPWGHAVGSKEHCVTSGRRRAVRPTCFGSPNLMRGVRSRTVMLDTVIALMWLIESGPRSANIHAFGHVLLIVDSVRPTSRPEGRSVCAWIVDSQCATGADAVPTGAPSRSSSRLLTSGGSGGRDPQRPVRRGALRSAVVATTRRAANRVPHSGSAADGPRYLED